MKDKVLVFHAQQFDFKDQQTGRPVQFTKLKYTTGRFVEANDEAGVRVADIRGSFPIFNKFAELPGWYELDFEQKGKSVELVGAKFLDSFSQSELVQSSNGHAPADIDPVTGEILAGKK